MVSLIFVVETSLYSVVKWLFAVVFLLCRGLSVIWIGYSDICGKMVVRCSFFILCCGLNVICRAIFPLYAVDIFLYWKQTLL